MPFPDVLPKRVLLLAAIVVTGLGAFYCARLVQAVLLMSSVVGPGSMSEDAASNARGDEAGITTEGSGRWREPDQTVIRLRPARHWFWTTLLTTKSFGIREQIKWRNDNMLDISLDFGCLVHRTPPVTKAGTISVSYHFTLNDKSLAKDCSN